MSEATSAEKHAYLVFGASGGIGSCVARRLRSAGHNVLLASRESDRLAALAEEIDAPSRGVDASSFQDVSECFDAAKRQFGQLSGVVNCVGSVVLKPAHLTSQQELSDTLAVNLVSAFAVVRAAAEHLRESGGSVVLMSSAAAGIGLANHEAIAAAKGAVEGLTRSAAATYASRNLRINAVAPGLVKTKLTERIWSNQRSAEHSCKLHPLGRLGEPDAVASLVAWLLAPENDWVTGQVIGVDGGLGSLKLG